MGYRMAIAVLASCVAGALASAPAGAHDDVSSAAGPCGRGRGRAHGRAGARARSHTRAVTADDARAPRPPWPALRRTWVSGAPVVDWPVVGVHVALLPNGKVLAYDSIGDNATETYPVQDHTRATVWDPATGTQTPVNVDTGFNVFCSGLAHLVDGRLFLAGGNKDAAAQRHRPDASLRPGDQHVEPGAEHGGRPLVSDGHAAEQRRDADHLRAREHARGADARRRAAHAEHGVAEPAAVSVDGRRARRAGVLLGPRPDAAGTRHERHRRMADVRAARRDQPRLRRARDLRHRQDAGRGRRSLDDRRSGRRLQRGDAAGHADGADGLRPPAAQPHRAGRRHGPRDRRQLLAAPGSSTSTPASIPRSSGTPRRVSGGRWRRCRSRASTTRPRCCCPTGASSPPAAGSAAPATRSATWARTPRSSRRRTCSRPTARSRRARSSPRRRPRRPTAPSSTSAPAPRRRSARSRSSGSAPSRTPTTWSSATSR